MAPTLPHTGLQEWLDHLSVLYPAGGVVHVGAGSGHAASRYANWRVPQLMMFEADAGLARKIPDSIGAHSGWSARNALVGATVGEQAFYVATNPNESGVIEPEALSFLWRNLRARERRMLPVTTVDAALAEVGWKSGAVDWLVADCLPALPVLQGATGSLENCDVVLVRVLLGGAASPVGAGVAEVDAFLANLGFRAVARVEERLPAIATAIYVRDWKQTRRAESQRSNESAPLLELAIAQARAEGEERLALMAGKLADANERLATSEARAEALAQLNRNQEQSIAAHDTVVADLKTILADKDAALADLHKSITDKDAAVAEQHRLRTGLEAEVASLQAQLARQMREHDDEALLQALQLAESKASLTQAVQIQTRLENRIAEQQARIDELTRDTQAQTELAIQRGEQVAQLNRACEELVQQATQRQARLDELAHAADAAAADKSAQTSRIESLQAQLASLEHQRDEAASRLANEQARIQQILDAKSALDAALSHQSQLLAAHDATNAELRQANAQALARIASQQSELAEVQELADRLKRVSRDHDEHARVSRERLAHIEKLQAEAGAHAARISQLEAERAELDYRQRLLDEELVKAEAQIDLIKDVVLREKAF